MGQKYPSCKCVFLMTMVLSLSSEAVTPVGRSLPYCPSTKVSAFFNKPLWKLVAKLMSPFLNHQARWIEIKGLLHRIPLLLKMCGQIKLYSDSPEYDDTLLTVLADDSLWVNTGGPGLEAGIESPVGVPLCGQTLAGGNPFPVTTACNMEVWGDSFT